MVCELKKREKPLLHLRYDLGTFKPTLRIALPAVIESFFMAFAGFVDTLMVSALGSDSVAAVGLTAQPKFIALSIFIALGVATSAVVARRYGEGRRDEANRTLLTALLFALVTVAAITALFMAGADPIIRFCGSSENTHADAVMYLRIIIAGFVFNSIQIVVNAAQRGAGNTRITMTTNVTSNVINVLFNYLLIGGHWGFPALGIRGAALATVLGTVVSSLMSLISLCRREQFLSIPYMARERLRPAFKSFKVLCKFGYSIFAEQLLLRIGLAATAIMAAKTGDDSMAAHQVALHIMTLSFAFGDGLQSAAVALIGRSLGEKNEEKAKEYGRTCQLFGGIITVVVALTFFFGAEWAMGLFFRNDPQIVDIGRGIMWVMIPIVLFQIRQVIYMGCLRGAGDTLFTAIVSVSCVTVLRTAVSYLCAFTLGWGIIGVWMGIFADQVGRFILAGARFKSGKWTHIRI